MSEYSKEEALGDYGSAVDTMRSAFRCMEKITPKFVEWAKSRREWEEKNDECDCISAILEDSAVAMRVVMHVMQTYGTILKNMSQHLEDHGHGEGEEGEDGVTVEVYAAPEEVLSALRKAVKIKKESDKKTRH